MKTLMLIAMLITHPTHADATTCRSQSIKHQFDKQQGYSHGRKGYVVDHKCALSNGGLDSIINMQYQTIEEGKIKDRIEGTPAGKLMYCNPMNSTPTRQVFNCKKN